MPSSPDDDGNDVDDMTSLCGRKLGMIIWECFPAFIVMSECQATGIQY